MKSIYVTDISLAAILAAFGVPVRKSDPVTREVRNRNGKDVETGKFWFDVSNQADADKARSIIDDYGAARNWEGYNRDKEDPLYWMKGALENRTALIHMFHNGAVPMKVIESGDKTILIGPRISEKDKSTLKKAL